MKKKTKTILFTVISIIILGLIIIPRLKPSPTKENSLINARSREQVIPVNVYILKASKLDDKLLTTGSILANEEVELRSEVSGKITKIFFSEGRKVKKDDLLIKINDSELQAQLLKANSQKKLAEEKEYRQKVMLKKEAISQEEYDISLNELNSLDAELQLIKAQIDKTEIHAPFDGVIGLKAVSDGSYVTPDKKIATLQNINPLKIDFSIPEKYFTQIKVGSGITFGIQGINKKYSGKIYAIEPKIDASTRTIQIRAITKNEKSEIFPGSFAQVEINLKVIDNALSIPTEALIPDVKGQKVYIVKNGKAIPKPVEVGIRKEKIIQVVSGLSEGDSVITSGLMQIRPNAQVKVSSVK
ncbi:MAG: efflux RND transporter periplasmic adaptor subunit [Ignavibacteriales bacterium]|nr:efflux RND transporter periplasmic adaptor subunit [Ignavibacteriales bacterium]